MQKYVFFTCLAYVLMGAGCTNNTVVPARVDLMDLLIATEHLPAENSEEFIGSTVRTSGWVTEVGIFPHIDEEATLLQLIPSRYLPVRRRADAADNRYMPISGIQCTVMKSDVPKAISLERVKGQTAGDFVTVQGVVEQFSVKPLADKNHPNPWMRSQKSNYEFILGPEANVSNVVTVLLDECRINPNGSPPPTPTPTPTPTPGPTPTPTPTRGEQAYSALYHYQMGETFRTSGNCKDAIPEYDLAIKVDSINMESGGSTRSNTNRNAHFFKAYCHGEIGQYEVARSTYNLIENESLLSVDYAPNTPEPVSPALVYFNQAVVIYRAGGSGGILSDYYGTAHRIDLIDGCQYMCGMTDALKHVYLDVQMTPDAN